MKIKILILAAAAVVAGSSALIELDGAGIVPADLVEVVPAPVVVTAAWTWRIIGGLVAAWLSWRLIVGRRAAPADSGPQIKMRLVPPPEAKLGPTPQPPEPYLARPYAGGRLFTGRTADRAALTEWFKDGKASPVRALIAGGGAGKSALAWTWVRRDVLDRPMPDDQDDPPDVRKSCRLHKRSRPRGVIWWSFDAPASTFSVFLDEALTYLTSGAVTSGSYLSSRSEKVDNLVKLLCEDRYLLVLDGFERELRAFARLEAAYAGDDPIDDDHGDGRLCADMHAAEFLRRLASQRSASRVLILSRLLPAELLEPVAEELGELEPADALELLKRGGIDGEEKAMKAVCAQYEHDPLGLCLLAGLLRGDSTAGRIRGARNVPGGLAEILEAAIDAVDTPRQLLLSHVAVIRGPFTPGQAAMFNPYDDDAPLREALDNLAARGLLMFDEAAETYDMHPLVRSHAYARLRNRARVHAHLAAYFAQVPPPKQISDMEDLQPALEQYHSLIGARSYEEAWALFTERIMRPLRDRFADQELLMRLLHGLFAGTRPLLKQRLDRARAIDVLAKACSYSGETQRAVELCEANVPSFRSSKDEAQAMLLGTLAGVQSRLGRIEAAESNLRRLVELTTKLDRTAEQAIARNRLGLLLAHRGAFDEALAELDQAFSIAREAQDDQIQGVCFSYYAHRALLMNDASAALDAARKSRAIVEKIARRAEPDEHDYVRSGWLLGAACVGQAAEDPANAKSRLDEAERYLLDALSRCRRGDLVGFEPDLLLAGARWHRATDKLPEAARLAADSMSMAMRCGYRLKQAEGLNFMARLALDAGDLDNARKSAKMAAEAARCDGPPWCYQPALDEAQAIIDEIDGPPVEQEPAAEAA